MFEIGDNLTRKFINGGHDIRQASLDSAAGHAIELGRSRVLHQGDPRLLLDSSQAQRAVRSHTREDDTDAASCISSARERKNESIGRRSPLGSHRVRQVQYPVQYGHVFIGRYYVDAIGLYLKPLFGLDDFEGGGAL